jgi:hypothetical protein
MSGLHAAFPVRIISVAEAALFPDSCSPYSLHSSSYFDH